MAGSARFVAQILESGAAGFAGVSASLLAERHPRIVQRYEPAAFDGWKLQLQRWLLDLSAALDAGEPRLFEARMLWTRKAFRTRDVPDGDLEAALEALRDALRDRLPDDAAPVALPVLDRAIATLGSAEPDGPEAGRPAPGREALTYLATILEGRPRAAVDRLLETVDAGGSIHDAYLNVLIPAQREAGRMWHVGELGVADEHVITSTTQRAMALLCGRTPPARRRDASVLLASATGNVHDIGIRAVADFFEIAGWRTVNLGADVPPGEIARSVQQYDVDLVVLAAHLDPHVKAVRHTIESIRGLERHDVKVIVGGPAFDTVPDLWRSIGADGYAAAIEETEPLGSRLIRA